MKAPRLLVCTTLLFLLALSIDATAQNRDLHAERIVLDDNATDGGFNTLTIQTPVPGLTADRILTIPDANGTLLTMTGPLISNQILFGGPAGQPAQSAGLTWDDGAGVFDVGSGDLVVNSTTLNFGGGLFVVDPALLVYNGPLLQMPGILNLDGPNGLDLLGGLLLVDPLGGGTMTFTGNQFLIPPMMDLNAGGLDLFTSAIVMDPLGNHTITGTATAVTFTDGTASMTGGVISDGAGSTMTGGTVTGTTLTDGTASMTGGTISDGAGSTISGGTGSFNTITTSGLPAGSTSTDLVTSNGGALETRTLASLGGTIPVNSDASLTGDGTTGSPLGIDLTNPNTWIGAQTFSSVDIDGGTIDGTAIGGATPASGTFTTISDGIASMSGGTISDGFGASMFGGTVTAFTITDGIASMSGGTVSDGAGSTMTGGTVTGTTVTDGTASMTGGTISDGAGSTMTGGMVTGTTVTDGTASMTGGTISDGAGSTISGGTGSFNTITTSGLPAGSTSTDLVTSNGGALETRTLASLGGTISVSSDASLTGDGTTGSPLGIDLTNANTWTGTQTFDNTIILGNDPTPSPGIIQLHDNTGANGNIGSLQTAANLTNNRTYVLPDADGTLALVGNIVTDATLTGDGTTGNQLRIDLTNANTWTGTQTFTSIALSGNLDMATNQVVNIGTGTTTFDAQGDLLINGATTTPNARLIVNEGHWTSEQATAPTVTGQTGGFAAGGTVTGTDVAGTVSINSNLLGIAGTFTVTFDQAYGTAPIVVVTAADFNAGTAGYYVSATTPTTFTVTTIGLLAASLNHQYNYHVIEAQ